MSVRGAEARKIHRSKLLTPGVADISIAAHISVTPQTRRPRGGQIPAVCRCFRQTLVRGCRIRGGALYRSVDACYGDARAERTYGVLETRTARHARRVTLLVAALATVAAL